jgi:NDP-sugar pyrophosphorylase family protein
MQIIIPMAGNGKRFSDAGYTEPKPLIKVHGKPMIEHMVNLFQSKSGKPNNFVFICNDEHLKSTNLREVLENLKLKSVIVSHSFERPLGPVYSTLQAIEYIDDKEPAIVTYCDFDTDSDYKDFENMANSPDVDGAISCFTGFQPHFYGSDKFAGAKADDNNAVSEVKEKHCYAEDKAKGWHATGVNYFKNGRLIKKYFKELVDRNLCHDNGEYYVSQVYNLMIEDGLKIILHQVNHFCAWGTPESLNEYTTWQTLIKDTSSKELKDKYIRKLEKQFPHIPKDDYKKILNYYRDFNKQKLAR